MKRFLVLTMVALAAVAWAGSRAKEHNGAAPAERSACTSAFGVTLLDTEGCRLSIRSDDGGTVQPGYLRSYYCDTSVGWVRSASNLDCQVEASVTADGGASSAFVCPDTEPLARFGRQGAAYFLSDGGPSTDHIVRVECWGREIP